MNRLVLLDHLKSVVSMERRRLKNGDRQPPIIGLCNGCFDILTVGHITFLEAAKSHCELLVVAVDVDERVAELKGAGRPYRSWLDRATLVGSLRAVDRVTPVGPKMIGAETPSDVMRAVRPDVYIGRIEDPVPEIETARELGIAVWRDEGPKAYSVSGEVERWLLRKAASGGEPTPS